MQTNAAAESGIDEGQKLVILDVRPKEARMQDGIIPGAVPAQPEDIDPVVATYSRELEIVVYCACPNEESADRHTPPNVRFGAHNQTRRDQLGAHVWRPNQRARGTMKIDSTCEILMCGHLGPGAACRCLSA
jgi:hypothetical protein